MKERPELYNGFNPWDPISDLQSLMALCGDAGSETTARGASKMRVFTMLQRWEL